MADRGGITGVYDGYSTYFVRIPSQVWGGIGSCQGSCYKNVLAELVSPVKDSRTQDLKDGVSGAVRIVRQKFLYIFYRCCLLYHIQENRGTKLLILF